MKHLFYKPSSKYTYRLYKGNNFTKHYKGSQCSKEQFLHLNFTPPYPACTQPVRLVPTTGQSGCHCLIHTTGQTGHTDHRSSQNRRVAHTALKGATRQLPSLGVSLHHFPPLCITADEFDTAGAEVNLRMA